MQNVAGNKYGLKIEARSYTTIGVSSLMPNPSNQQLFLHSFSAFNGNASACDVGLSIQRYSGSLSFYTFNGTTGTNVTAQIQAGTPTNLFDTTSGHGFLVEGKKVFGLVVFPISQAQTGSPTYTYQYWNGTAWTTLNLNNTPTYTGTYAYIAFNAPIDWMVGDNGTGSNTMYAIKVVSGTAPTQAVQATGIIVRKWIAYNQSVPSGARLQATFEEHPYLLEAGESIAPYFSTANVLNAFEISFQIQP